VIKVLKTGVHRISMASPADVSGLQRLIEDGTVDPTRIVASIGKTEGNGGANDFTRALATTSAATLLSRYLGVPAEEVTERIAFVWSGGCEGVLSPHMTVFTRDDAPASASGNGAPARAGDDGRLALSVQKTRSFLPEEVGRMAEVEEVAAAVRRALAELAVPPEAVHYVQVKGPLLTPASIANAESRGAAVVSTDPNRSKAYARGATALGVALGLGEVEESRLSEEAIATDMDLYSSVASTSAGGELTNCEVLVFANSSRYGGDMRIGHGVLRDATDIAGVHAALANAGLEVPSESNGEQSRIRAVFAKAEAPVGGLLHGQRTTMLSDADIHWERHARAAVGAVLAAVTGDPRIFVSGGTEHQNPPGQAPIAVIVEA
jgi:cyanuric acid amidohydrolase